MPAHGATADRAVERQQLEDRFVADCGQQLQPAHQRRARSATSASAVGYDDSSMNTNRNRTLVESWNGSKWTVVLSPNRGMNENQLVSVSCVSATSCKAVGDHEDARNITWPLIESWNGAKWTIVASVSGEVSQSQLNGVLGVLAMSRVWPSATALGTLTESWVCTAWKIVASPYPGPFGNLLDSVSCACCHVVQGGGLLSAQHHWCDR